MGAMDRIMRVVNAFRTVEQEDYQINRGFNVGSTSTYRSHTSPTRYSSERSIISSIYTRIGIDVAKIPLRHVKLDDKGRYSKDVDSHLSSCLNLEANLDQGPFQFRLDIVSTLFDEGVAAIVPVDTDKIPVVGGDFQILTMRVGKILQWYPRHVRVSLYNEATGLRQEVTLEKRFVAIVENPLYAVMNETNSTLQRLIRKLSILDGVDEAAGSGKLDLLIQLPYTIKSETRRNQAELRRADIEFQLKGSKYGIAYIDSTEKVTQLNRPSENNLLAQIKMLKEQLYTELGLTPAVMDGTADEAAMVNYRNRTIEPILDVVIQAMQRAFLGQMGTNKKERIQYYQNPFNLMPIASIAEVADKFTRNEVLTSNEIRQFMGIPPSDDPKADQLINSNMPQPGPAAPPGPSMADMDKIMNEVLGGLESDLAKIGGDDG